MNHTWLGRLHKFQFHCVRLHSQQETALQFPHQFIQFDIRVIQLQRSRLNLRQIKDITDELQQQSIIVLDDADIFLLFLFFFGRCQYPRETDNSIQWSTDFMAHIGQEGRLQAIGFFGKVFGCSKFLLHLLPVGDDKRRTHQSQGISTFIAGIYSCLRLYPFHLAQIVFLYVDDAVFFFHFFHPSFYQVPVSLFHPFTVFLEDFREILGIGHR